MSEFGDGTFAQALLEAIQTAQVENGKTNEQTVAEVIRVLAYLTEDDR